MILRARIEHDDLGPSPKSRSMLRRRSTVGRRRTGAAVPVHQQGREARSAHGVPGPCHRAGEGSATHDHHGPGSRVRPGVPELVPSARNPSATGRSGRARQHRDRRAIHPLDEVRVHAEDPGPVPLGRDACRARLLRDLVQRAPAARGAARPDAARGVPRTVVCETCTAIRATRSLAKEGEVRGSQFADERGCRRPAHDERESIGAPRALAYRLTAPSWLTRVHSMRRSNSGRALLLHVATIPVGAPMKSNAWAAPSWLA